MIRLKSAHEIELMKEAGRIAAMARAACAAMVQPGITTKEIDRIARRTLKEAGAKPSFLGYNGFPAAVCCSVNDEVIHGIPGKRVLKDGDLVKIDIGSIYEGFQGDCACTIPCGKISPEAEKLLLTTRQSFYEGIKAAVPGNRICDISRAIQEYNEQHGYSLVRDFVGHGIGREMHEEPEVPNYYTPGRRGPKLFPGMTLAIEPMVNMGRCDVKVGSDGWTVTTADGSLSAHYENTILITEEGAVILTAFPAENPYL